MEPGIVPQRPLKAYNNQEFIQSSSGRVIRMISEYEYPELQLRNVAGTIVFFGSARTLSEEAYAAKLSKLNDKLISEIDAEEKTALSNEIEKMKRNRWLTDIYTDTVKLAEMVSRWSLSRPIDKRYYVVTGGGPGYMEAANRGAAKAKAPSIGLNISIPFEQEPNIFISPEYNFEFHYFFMRKFWFITKAKAIVVMPGGFGTFDEMVEILTLMKTQKLVRPIPFVLYHKEFWDKAMDFQYLIDCGMISENELNYITYCNTPEEVFKYLTSAIENNERE